MPKNSRKQQPAGDDDFSRDRAALQRYKREGRWDEYFWLAARPKFQAAWVADVLRGSAAADGGPLDFLGEALADAIELRRIPDAATLTLACARWSSHPLLQADGGPGGRDPAADPAAAGNREIDVLRTLLRAWEEHDNGNPGEARHLLGTLLGGAGAPALTAMDSEGWAVLLLQHAFFIDARLTTEIIRRPLFDDNGLVDLAKDLTAAGELGHARTAALAIRNFTESRAKALGEIAISQALAGDNHASAETERLARQVIADDAGWDGSAAVAGLPDAAPVHLFVVTGLAALATARALRGDNDGARAAFADVRATAARQRDDGDALAEVARAQVRAGLLDDAAQTIEASPDDYRRREAEDDLIAARAERGELPAATGALHLEFADAFTPPGALRALAAAAARTDDLGQAESLAATLRDADTRGRVLVEIASAALAAGRQRDAVRIADGIEWPRWRAEALVRLASADAAADSLSAEVVKDALSRVPDLADQALLWARYAVTRDGSERARSLEHAVKLAGRAAGERRWSLLANIGAVQAEAGLLVEAAKTFAAARSVRDVEDFELREICRVQVASGDRAGARETIALALGRMAKAQARYGLTAQVLAIARTRSAAEPERLLASVTLSVIASAMAKSGAAEGVGPVLADAASLADGLPGEQREAAAVAIIEAYVAVGDLDAAEAAVRTLLRHDLAAGVSRGVHVADSLRKAGEQASAAALLRRLARKLGRRAGAVSGDPGFSGTVTELATAQVRAGAIHDARATAALDLTGLANVAVTGSIAVERARGGDTAAAIAAVRSIPSPLLQAGVLVGITGLVTASQQAELAPALAAAVNEVAMTALDGPVEADPGLVDAVAILLDIAGVQAKAGDLVAAKATLALAAELASAVPRPIAQARALAEVAKGWAVSGDHALALSAALEVAQHDDAAHQSYGGEAVAVVISGLLAAKGNELSEADERRVTQAVAAIKAPGWRAVALLTVLLAAADRNSAVSRGATVPPLDLMPVRTLINAAPEGSPRERLVTDIIERLLAHGRYAEAAGLAAADASSSPDRLADIVTTLSREVPAAYAGAAADAVASLLPYCSRYPVAAHAACAALARVSPADAAVIARAVGHSATDLHVADFSLG